VRCIQGFSGETEGKRPLGRHRRRWEDDINVDIQEMGRVGMEWIAVVQDRDRCRAVVNAIMSLQVPQNTGNFLTG
jgi:hypothetical protein